MRIIIMAGGKQKRYAPETPKQFIKIDGVRIIERLIDQFKDMGDISVIVKDPRFDYLKDRAEVVLPTEETHELSKFMSSYDIWKDEDEVMFVWGDCFITDDAMKIIKESNKEEEFTFYGIWGEMLCMRIKKTSYAKFIRAIDYIKELQERHEGGLCGSWTLYRLLLGKDLMEHKHYSNFIMIEDESCDFDGMEDVEYFQENYKKYKCEVI